MNLRKFLLSLRIFGRYRYFRRQFKRQKRENAATIAAMLKAKEKLTEYYELRLETMRQEQKSLLFALTDKVLVAGKSSVVSHVTHDAEDKAERALHPVEERAFDAEKDLSGDQRSFYLDLKEGFAEAEAANGRSDSEIQRLWKDGGFEKAAIAQVQGGMEY